jgi:hypothetical protein
MKNILLFTLISLILSSCSNNEKKAKKLIKDYLKTTMNDYSSYEPMEFSKLDSTKSMFESSERGKSLLDLQQITLKAATFNMEQMAKTYNSPLIDSLFNQSFKRDMRESDSLFDLIKREREHFKPELIGWEISHTFRGKNGFGGTIINNIGFRFDINLTEIIEVIDFNQAFRKMDEKKIFE